MRDIDDEDLLFLEIQQIASRVGDDGRIPGLTITQSAFVVRAAGSGLRSRAEVSYATDCLIAHTKQRGGF